MRAGTAVCLGLFLLLPEANAGSFQFAPASSFQSRGYDCLYQPAWLIIPDSDSVACAIECASRTMLYGACKFFVMDREEYICNLAIMSVAAGTCNRTICGRGWFPVWVGILLYRFMKYTQQCRICLLYSASYDSKLKFFNMQNTQSSSIQPDKKTSAKYNVTCESYDRLFV